jgi:ADP-ribose pyrophosphatase YjhB (NUDIX family)
VVIDPADRLLLMRWTHAEVGGPTGSVWITPGGGGDASETYEQAALRELREETGINDVPLGPCVWTREHTFEVGEKRHF